MYNSDYLFRASVFSTLVTQFNYFYEKAHNESRWWLSSR